MKILYIANERGDAQVAATALRGIAPNVTVLWAFHVDQAADWIHENQDLAALVVEAQVDGQSCISFLKHVRSLGLRAPVVVIVPEEAAPRLESLKARGYDFVAKNHSLFRNLPVVVTQAIERGLVASDVERRNAEHASDMTASAACGSEQRTQDADLEQKLAHAEAALQEAEQRHLSAMTTAAGQLAERQAQYEIGMARAAATWDMVDEQLREAATEVERARQNQASAAADVDRLSRRESELSFLLAEATATHSTLKGQLADAETALEAANERTARERLTAAEQVAKRQTEFQTQLEQEVEKRQSVEETLARAVTAGDDAEERHASAMTTAAALLAERQTQFDAELTAAVAARNTLAHQARDLQAALGWARQDLESNAAAIERLTRREAELTSMLTEATTTRNTLERRLAGTETAFKDANERATRERLAAAKRAAAREAELDGLTRQERVTRADVEQKLAHVEGALSDAEQRHASAMTTAATELAERQRQFETELSEIAAARESLTRQLGDAEVVVEGARQNHSSAAAEVERLTQREAELASQLADAAATRNTLELQLTDAVTAIKDADERATCERVVATARHADVETRLTQEIKTRETLERELAETRSAAADADRWFREETAAMTARTREQAARLEDQIARERLDQESRLAEMQEQLRNLALERDALDESLGTIQEQSQRLNTEHREERDSLERARLTAEAEVRRLAAEHTETQHNLEEARRNFQQTRDRVSSEHAGALAKLVASVTERDAQIEEQAARHSASLQAAASERTQLQDGVRTTLAARNREIEQLQGKLKATIQELDVTRSRREVLQTEAARVPQLQEQLDKSRAEIRRQFEHSPLALCRCTRVGVLTHVNRAFAALAGYRKADELPSAGFPTTVFESPDDLFWLIERCMSTKAKESVETTWRGRKGGSLVVRLSAFASASDVIEIVAEDLTNLRALQDRLGQAHRMEAVGRLASEVAVTCGNLLRDVHQNAQQWLMNVSGNTALRRQGEMLLDEVTRAASFLRQLAAYSDEETSALAPVDLNRVLRDLEPVLKRVAGDDIELQLPKTSSPLDVDVKAERVERLLVNLASYGRERMPLGGRLRIDLATVVVDRRFIAKYPNVRQGPHALITITEVRRTMRAEEPLRFRDAPTEPSSDRSASEKPGVDLGALQGLIRECSGHLWMTVEPPGDMVVKIHLPLGASDDRTHPRTSAMRRSRGRMMARWFQH